MSSNRYYGQVGVFGQPDMQCQHDGCGWRAIAPSARAARKQYTQHVIDEHTTEVDVEIPDGMVQVRTGDGDEWELMTVEEAKEFHREGGD